MSFHKSSYSNEERECVEIAVGTSGAIAVRDSKRTDGPTLHVAPTAWTAFLTTLQSSHP
ncbi:DUF397 domain-containing protein [Streptomyces chrestomyceticus]|uniref:DUF397 domain-containing protein n=1 Tax=Streptomyces chrestomyceticus TaxID=68185 RepID=UPI0019D1FEB0|nr:DUF397 domain-containing protein [Streptomyces chrestomyceticus]